MLDFFINIQFRKNLSKSNYQNYSQVIPAFTELFDVHREHYNNSNRQNQH